MSVEPVFVNPALGHLVASRLPESIDQFQLALNSAFTAGKASASREEKPLSPDDVMFELRVYIHRNGTVCVSRTPPLEPSYVDSMTELGMMTMAAAMIAAECKPVRVPS